MGEQGDKKETKEETETWWNDDFIWKDTPIAVNFKVLIKLSGVSVKCLYNNWDREIKNCIR